MTLRKPFQDPSWGWDVDHWRKYWFDLYRLWYCVQVVPIESVKMLGRLTYKYSFLREAFYQYFRYSLTKGIVWFE